MWPIEKGIPVPARKKRTGDIMNFIKTLEKGDSIFLGLEDLHCLDVVRATFARCYYGIRVQHVYEGSTFMGYRLWRTR